ncbi:SSI family serine proteinase inhibitor [Streptomyces angustmyceticus]|uniref:SSI family serine proteinase inhibitor n=1 Tax=Streptomyces angustmyceticus TaxID=285578 RepID=UPI0037FF4EBA
MAAGVVVRPRRVRAAYRPALASLEPVMPHRRTSAPLASAASPATTTPARRAAATSTSRRVAGAAATVMTRLAATTAAAGRVSVTAAVSVVSVTAALVLAGPAASAAPIPLPHHWSGGGIPDPGHHAPVGRHAALAGPHELRRHGGPDGHDAPAGHHAHPRHHALADHGRPSGHRTPARHHAPAGHHPSGAHRTPVHHSAPARHRTAAEHHEPTGHHHTPATHHAPHTHHTPGRRHAPVDHLTVTVLHSGSAAGDGTFELYCHPGGGNHRHVKGACAKLDGMTKWGKDPFAPVPQGVNCTMMYGGPATAHVTGTWAGRPVNADFRRTNGCEISRWSRFEPLLPPTGS